MELPRVLEQLWGLEGPARPGPKPTFQLSDIAAAAIELADAGGLPAVSMSKVASALGFTTMSLYRYVDSKDDLYTVMLEYAFGEAPVLYGEDWRSRMESWAAAFRDGLRAHPWILQVPITEPPLSPSQLTWMESALQAFHDTPLTAGEKLSAMLLVNIYVRGAVQLTIHQFTATPEEAAVADRRYAERLQFLATEERFPAIAAGLQRPAELEINFETDGFADGLETILDGIQAGIDKG
ncbi:TetR/AcrR family transcriptional regulator [Kribbella albertanoniae]|uniref:TetR family transcriptional regulator n=1 Tax=Kribbella albertanoniae TaxID=1266829 RepID=A0A4R4QBR5_9ACTN|nr:TetR/AcrR family transcriptional regulator C-terminal domain-containing protein [Kribbella albertanoniae]TDC32569.1 TetR family transcriptional regulator [Kribbella albertanoniae]